MELKISNVKNKSGNQLNPFIRNDASVADKQEAPLEKVEITSGVELHRRGKRYDIVIGGESLSVTEQEAAFIYANPESVYEIVLDKTRRFHFNASEDKI